MQKSKPESPARPRHAGIQRDSMEDIREFQSSSNTGNSGEVRYRDPNRDRALGEADRTGRHFDAETTEAETDEEVEATEASEDHEAD